MKNIINITDINIEMVQSQSQTAPTEVVGDTWIFCYGSNGPKQLCKRIGTPAEDILTRMAPVKCAGWRRSFCGTACHCGTSPATIEPTGDMNDYIEGVAVRLTPVEVVALDPFEGYPEFYNRQIISMERLGENAGPIEA